LRFATNLARFRIARPVHTGKVHEGGRQHADARSGSDDALDVRLEVADGGARLHLAGAFTRRTAGRVRAALELVSVAAAVVEIDLARVSRIDDHALDLLASARAAARREGWKLVLSGRQAPAAAPRPPVGPVSSSRAAA